MFGADQSKLSTGTFRQARTGPKGKVRSYFFPSSSLQCLIGYFVSEEVFFVQGARKLHHVASPVVETIRGRDRRTACAIPAQCFTSGSRDCEVCPGINLD